MGGGRQLWGQTLQAQEVHSSDLLNDLSQSIDLLTVILEYCLPLNLSTFSSPIGPLILR